MPSREMTLSKFVTSYLNGGEVEHFPKPENMTDRDYDIILSINKIHLIQNFVSSIEKSHIPGYRPLEKQLMCEYTKLLNAQDELIRKLKDVLGTEIMNDLNDVYTMSFNELVKCLDEIRELSTR